MPQETNEMKWKWILLSQTEVVKCYVEYDCALQNNMYQHECTSMRVIVSRCITHRGKFWETGTDKLTETVCVLRWAEGGREGKGRIISVSKSTSICCFILDKQWKVLIGNLTMLMR